MTPTSRRICFALTLLGLVAAALMTGLRARHDGIAIKAHFAGMMQLQGMPDTDHADFEAVVGAGMGWLVLNEALTPIQFAGGALILLGIFVARPRSEPA